MNKRDDGSFKSEVRYSNHSDIPLNRALSVRHRFVLNLFIVLYDVIREANDQCTQSVQSHLRSFTYNILEYFYSINLTVRKTNAIKTCDFKKNSKHN